MNKKLLITDLDGTLTKESLVLNHAGYLIGKGIIKDNGSFQAWKKDLKNENLIIAVAENYRAEITGMKEFDLNCKDFVKSFFLDKNKWYPETLKRLQKMERSQDTDIFLITGSSDFLVKHLAYYLNVNYFATEYLRENGCLNGKVNGMFSETQKDDCVQWNININEYDYIEAWGDTASDYGLFKHANYKILVEPTKQTLETLIQKTKIDEII